MKAATVHEIKQELVQLPPSKLTDICLRLARFKKENKELLTFLLFEAGDLSGYIQSVKLEMNEQFAAVNVSNIYYAKKTFRKILRNVNKHIRYIGDKPAEAELLIHFCEQIKKTGVSIRKSTVLTNLINTQISKIRKLVGALHEDLQYEFIRQVEALEEEG